MDNVKENLKLAFTKKNIIVRLFTSWFLLGLFILIFNIGKLDYEIGQDLNIVLSIGIFFLCFILLSYLSFSLIKYETDSKMLFLISVLLSIAYIMTNAIDNIYMLLGIVLVELGITIYCYNENKEFFNKHEISKKTVYICAALFILLELTIKIVILIIRYKSYFCPTFDYGIFLNSFYNIRRTGLPIVACERDVIQTHFSVHFSFIFYLIYPIFWIFPYATTLQIIEAVSIALGIIPLILICNNKKLSNWKILFICFIYSFYPALTTGSFYDFHENCFLPFLLLFCFYFLDKKNYLGFSIFAILTLTVKEDAAFYVFVIGIYMILNRKEYLAGGITSAVSLIYFIVAVIILNKIGSGAMVGRYDNLIYDNGLFGAIKTIINNPDYVFSQLFLSEDGCPGKIVYLLLMFIPLAFIPILNKKITNWILLIPCLLNLLTLYEQQCDIFYQYSFGISAFLFYLLINNISELEFEYKNYFFASSILASFILFLGTSAVEMTNRIEIYNNNKTKYEAIDATLKTIPKDSSVCATEILVPHIADRYEIYSINYHKFVDESDLTDYIIVDKTYLKLKDDYTFEKDEELISSVVDKYEIEYEDEYLIVYKLK